jgi:hypothetical protein
MKLNPDRNGPLSASLNLMEYTRKDIILLVVTTMAVAVFLYYVAFAPAD